MTSENCEVTVEKVMRPASVIRDNVTFRDVLTKMIEEKKNSMLVVDAEGKLVGLVNAKALVRRAVPDYLEEDVLAARYATEAMFKEEAQKVADKPITDFMIADIKTIKLSDSVMYAAVMGLAGSNMRVPVIDDDGKPLGLLTRTEIKQLIGMHLGIVGCFKE